MTPPNRVSAIEATKWLMERLPSFTNWYWPTYWRRRMPHYFAKNEAAAKVKGVKRVCTPNRSPRAPNVNANRKKALVRNGQKWRTG
jgi:hypothetical protein